MLLAAEDDLCVCNEYENTTAQKRKMAYIYYKSDVCGI